MAIMLVIRPWEMGRPPGSDSRQNHSRNYINRNFKFNRVVLFNFNVQHQVKRKQINLSKWLIENSLNTLLRLNNNFELD